MSLYTWGVLVGKPSLWSIASLLTLGLVWLVTPTRRAFLWLALWGFPAALLIEVIVCARHVPVWSSVLGALALTAALATACLLTRPFGEGQWVAPVIMARPPARGTLLLAVYTVAVTSVVLGAILLPSTIGQLALSYPGRGRVAQSALGALATLLVVGISTEFFLRHKQR